MARRRKPDIPQPKKLKKPVAAKTPRYRGPKPAKLAPTQPRREDMPAWFEGTFPEWLTIWALNMLGLKMVNDPRPGMAGEDFVYQDAALGSYIRESGSTVVDVVVYREFPPIALPVQGDYWHPPFGPQFMQDMEIFHRLQAELGWTVIPLREHHLLRDAMYYVRAAVVERLNLSGYEL